MAWEANEFGCSDTEEEGEDNLGLMDDSSNASKIEQKEQDYATKGKENTNAKISSRCVATTLYPGMRPYPPTKTLYSRLGPAATTECGLQEGSHQRCRQTVSGNRNQRGENRQEIASDIRGLLGELKVDILQEDMDMSEIHRHVVQDVTDARQALGDFTEDAFDEGRGGEVMKPPCILGGKSSVPRKRKISKMTAFYDRAVADLQMEGGFDDDDDEDEDEDDDAVSKRSRLQSCGFHLFLIMRYKPNEVSQKSSSND